MGGRKARIRINQEDLRQKRELLQMFVPRNNIVFDRLAYFLVILKRTRIDSHIQTDPHERETNSVENTFNPLASKKTKVASKKHVVEFYFSFI